LHLARNGRGRRRGRPARRRTAPPSLRPPTARGPAGGGGGGGARAGGGRGGRRGGGLLEALAEGSEAGSSALAHGVRSDDVQALIRETIERTAARGTAPILPHAAPHAERPTDTSP